HHIVVANARAPRDGKYIERIGTVNPKEKENKKKIFTFLIAEPLHLQLPTKLQLKRMYRLLKEKSFLTTIIVIVLLY
ncbi:MAG: bS16 family ribosomal protein, partial [Acidobacteria bacterium]|nr:bS16 family ribosomal protein [Acidobacteriota bacterium]